MCHYFPYLICLEACNCIRQEQLITNLQNLQNEKVSWEARIDSDKFHIKETYPLLQRNHLCPWQLPQKSSGNFYSPTLIWHSTHKKEARRRHCSWTPPTEGVLKFKVDASSFGNLVLSWKRSTLWDHKSFLSTLSCLEELLIFSIIGFSYLH